MANRRNLDQLFEREVESVGIGVEIFGFLQPAARHGVGAHVFDVDRPAVHGGGDDRVAHAIAVAAGIASQAAAESSKPMARPAPTRPRRTGTSSCGTMRSALLVRAACKACAQGMGRIDTAQGPLLSLARARVESVSAPERASVGHEKANNLNALDVFPAPLT